MDLKQYVKIKFNHFGRAIWAIKRELSNGLVAYTKRVRFVYTCPKTDRFWFGVITGLFLVMIVEPGWPFWSKVVVIVPLYIVAHYFAHKLSDS